MRAGIDIGYFKTKVVASTNGGEVRRFSFPSVTGTPEEARFGLSAGYRDGGVLELGGQRYLYGQPAVDLSRFVERKEDRRWYQSDAYRVLVAAALAGSTDGTSVDMRVCSGLPLRYFGDREDVRRLFVGDHEFRNGDGPVQRVRVAECLMIGQPFGSFLAEALTDDGKLADEVWLDKHGIIDVGGHTTNVLSISELAEVQRESASVNVGGWKLVADMRVFLAARCPDLDLRDHEVARAVINGGVNYGGAWVDLADAVARHAAPLADDIMGVATQQWNGGMQMREVLVTGGGALLLGAALEAAYQHARVVDDPVFGNAIGYWKLTGRA